MEYAPDPERFQGKYRISSARRPGYDYSQAGAYFITICTAQRQPYFGSIALAPEQPDLVPAPVADFAIDRWLATSTHYTFAAPGAFVVMPDHVHGILDFARPDDYAGQSRAAFGPQRDNLAAVVRGFKAAVTAWAKGNGYAFGWQSRFHDRIIRTADERSRLEWYIEQNPARWATERNQPDGIFR